jgi:uncharacterized membrane protein YkvA (DUF1232 family)
MPMQITFELSDDDLDHFRAVMQNARERSQQLSEEVIIGNAQKLMLQVRHTDSCEFIRKRMNRLETMIEMLADVGWALESADRNRVRQALAYFSEPEDLIPDDIPGIGFIDDAIMIEMVTQELTHEIEAYRDFCAYRTAEASHLGEQALELGRADWLEGRRQELHSRMRRRRRRGPGSSGGGSPFSLFSRRH